MSAIKIDVREPKFLKKEKQSMFISFKYDFNTVKKVKSLPIRYYNPKTREWEVPTKHLNDILTMFSEREIQILSDTKETDSKPSEAISKPSEAISKPSFENSVDKEFEFKTNPFPHQKEAFEYALNHNKFLLADEQGLGKTKQAIDIAVNKKHTNNFKHTLIVCGVNSLKHNWLKEIGIHSDEKAHILGAKINKKGKVKDGSLKDRLNDLKEGRDEFFLVTNIESLRKPKKKKDMSDTQKTQLEMIETIEQLTKDGTIGMVIIDEIHKAKNAQSQQGKAIHHLKSYFKVALTGTPLMNKPIDLFNILKWLDEEKGSFYRFRGRYCVMGGFGGYEIVDYKNLKELQSRLGKVMLRRKKADVLDLPPKIRSTEYVEMKPKQFQIYNDIKREVTARIDEIKLSPNPLAQLIRLRQATADTSILSSKINESAKIERLKEMIEELTESGQKAIVFSNWTEVTSRVIEALEEYSPAVITGGTKDRQSEVEKFQNDDNCKVIIGTISAMGTGLTLTAASTVIFMDKPWNMANTEQAEDRAHRIGTTGTVNIVTLVCKDTIDERIEEIITEKAEMGKGLVEGDDDILSKYDKSELVGRLLS